METQMNEEVTSNSSIKTLDTPKLQLIETSVLISSSSGSMVAKHIDFDIKQKLFQQEEVDKNYVASF